MLRVRQLNQNSGLVRGLVLVAALLLPPAPVLAQTLGVVVDTITDSATVFDADSDTVLGTVHIPTAFIDSPVDCSIAGQSKAFVTDSSTGVHVIDLETLTLAAGPNPIPISTRVQESSISPDQRFLALCGEPISVVDTATQSEIGTTFTNTFCSFVEICSDGSVLTSGFLPPMGVIQRFTIDGAGALANTGDLLTSPNLLHNAYCSPDSASGVFVSFGHVQSFTIPGLALVDRRPLTIGYGHAAAVHPNGDRVYVRALNVVDVFGLTQASGALSAGPLFTIPLDFRVGVDPIVVHPDGAKLYVSESGKLGVYDADTGALLKTITDPNIVRPSGICLGVGAVPVDVDIKPGSDPNSINCNGGSRSLPVAILTTDDFDATSVDHTTVSFEGASEKHVNRRSGEPKRHEEDVDEDGDIDLMLHFLSGDTNLTCDSTQGMLTGTTFGGTAIEGSDAVRMVQQ